MYAVGYFLEVGIGTPADMQQYVFAHSNVFSGLRLSEHWRGTRRRPSRATSVRRNV